MSWESLLAFNGILLAALASPGAAFLYIVRTSITSGRAAGIATGIGLGTMAAIWTLAALLGLESVFRLFPWTYTALKLGGAFYLLWLAVQTWRHAKHPLGDAPTPRSRAFLGGLLVNLGNPKSALFAAAVIVVVFPKGLDARDIGLIIANHWLLEIVFYTLCATALSSDSARKGYLGFKPVFDRIAATFLGAFGLRLIVER
ncbi:MAG: LysE family transporter [Paracoccaceae bacterium]